MASPSPRKPCTVHTEPDFAHHVVLRITEPHPGSFDMTKLTEPFLGMFRTEPGFPRPIVRGRFPSATGRSK